MKLWEGMGYYSRVRNLQKCAAVIMKQYKGKLPEDPLVLQKLPGIGPYTAGAIASIAFQVPSAAVDGNVMRVYARVKGDRTDIKSAKAKKLYQKELQLFLDQNADALTQEEPRFVSLFTQAMMELGAIVCVPNGLPFCRKCPWRNDCTANLNNLCEEIPVRSKRKTRRIEERTILVIRNGDRFLIHRRKKTGLLAGLLEFPGTESRLSVSEALHKAEEYGMTPLRIHVLPDSRHIFTHVEWQMTAFEIQVSDFELTDGDYFWMTKKELQSVAIPSAFHAYLDYYSIR